VKPLLLTLQAFGPYAGKEIVDFRPAMDSGLFGIYGTTGSGKSTLFSGITFCLFGVSANDEQEQMSLRSDHAQADLQTKAELVFAVGAKQYLVRRWPTQNRPKKKGEGFVVDRHKADLFDVTGINVSDISETNSGRVIKETKSKDVDAAIENILGYGPRQFKQIVLLPQGQFETFLTAKTNARIEILRELFDVSLYKAMAEDMSEQAKAFDMSVTSDRRLCTQLLKNKGYETTDELEIGVTDAQRALAEKKVIAEEATREAHIQQFAYTAAEQVANSFVELTNARNVLKNLQDQDVDIKKIRFNKAQAENARLLLAPEADLKRCESGLIEAAALMAERESASVAANGEHKSQTEIVAQFVAGAAAQEQNRIWLTELRGHERQLQTASKHKGELSEKEAKFRTDTANLADHDGYCEELNKSLVAKRYELAAERDKDISIAKLNTQIAELTTRVQFARAYETSQNEVTGLERDVTELTEQIKVAKKQALSCENRFNLAEKNLSEIQALILAKKLVEGEACSVCGSHDHPAPAHGTPERQGLNEEFEQAEVAKKNADGYLNTLTAQHDLKRHDLSSKTESFRTLSVPQETAAALTHALSELKQALEAMQKTTTVEAIQSAITRITTELETLGQTRINLASAVEGTKSDLQQAQNAVEIALSEVPENLRDPNALQAHLSQLMGTITDYDNQYKQAQDAGLAAKDGAVLAQERLKAAQERHAEFDAKVKASKANWLQQLEGTKMSPEHFAIWKTHIPHIESYAEEIKIHESALLHTQGQIASLERTTVNKEMPELETLKKAAEDTAKTAADLNREATLAEAHHTELIKLKEDLKTQLERIAKMEEEAGPVKNLAAAFNGTLGPKITLETFAIAAMFDRVLEAANARLLPMSKGRYSLERETSGKGAAKRGLGIKVFDVQTGTQRATTTLSGGEKFIAALALALGLSDVVESLSGNIRLDTIFIDEGFGSLDAKDESGTLGDVLQTLTKLVGVNRSVGLISHVEIVKQEIPNGFYITSGTDGTSTIETRLI